MTVIIAYYWPRLIVSVVFAVYAAFVLKRKKEKLLSLLLKSVACFFLSCTVISILAELLLVFPFKHYILKPNISSSVMVNVVWAIFRLLLELVVYSIPSYLCGKILKLHPTIMASIYLETALIDRFAQVVAFSETSYLVVLCLEIIFLGIYHRSDLDFGLQNKIYINWAPVFYYNLAFFMVVNACYVAYLMIPELAVEGLTVHSIWLDGIVLVAAFAAAGFTKLNISASREQAHKMEYMRKFQDNQTDIISNFATISEAKSGETGMHIKRVSEYSAILAQGLLKDETEISYIKVASMMHDIGKLMIPNEIIEKPGKLNEEEFETMKTHSDYGNSLLSHSDGDIMSIARTIAYEHHERWDGLGYPRGLKGNEISIYAQIVSVADVFDALTSRRSYKEPWDSLEAKVEIIRQSGHQFSPQVVENFNKYFNDIEMVRKIYAD